MAAVWIGTACGRADVPDRIILIVVDTLRSDHVSLDGADGKTPNMAGLAEGGTVFENAIASFHQTTMSMGALFSGRTPSLESGDPAEPVDWIGSNWCGLARFARPGEDGCVPDSIETLAEKMRSSGYWTGAAVSNRLLFRPAGFDQGFDEWIEVGSHGSWDVQRVAESRSARHVNEAARRLVDERKGERIFLYLHYMDVHDWNQRRMSYPESVERLDSALGEILAFLGAKGLLEDALVVLTADHGEALGEKHLLPTTPTHYGNPSFEQVLRVPLIVSGVTPGDPGRVMRSEDSHRLILELAGAGGRPPSDLAPDELLVTEQAYQTYRAGRWKSFLRRSDGLFRLVDLTEDPGETLDVSAQHPEITSRHRLRIRELGERLATRTAPARELTPAEIETLRALGYLEQDEPGSAEPAQAPESPGREGDGHLPGGPRHREGGGR